MHRNVPAELVDVKPWDWPFLKLRPLPTFLIAGVMKSGTTSLYYYLREHPETIHARKKAPHFFNKRFEKGLNWYRRQFPIVPPPLWTKNPLVFEASASYFTSPEAPERIARLIPRVKIAAILRSPTDRAVSHYQHNLLMGREPLSFAEAIEQELKGSRVFNSTHYTTYKDFFFGYLSQGRYIEHLVHWLKFFPREALIIIRAEDYFSSPGEVFAELLEFLELSPWAPERFEVQNASPNYPNIDASMRDLLQNYFDPYNQKLYQSLGRDFEW